MKWASGLKAELFHCVAVMEGSGRQQGSGRGKLLQDLRAIGAMNALWQCDDSTVEDDPPPLAVASSQQGREPFLGQTFHASSLGSQMFQPGGLVQGLVGPMRMPVLPNAQLSALGPTGDRQQPAYMHATQSDPCQLVVDLSS